MFPATVAHKGCNTAFQFHGGVRMPLGPQDGHKPLHKGEHGASRFWRVVRGETYGYWQRVLCRKICFGQRASFIRLVCPLLFGFPELLDENDFAPEAAL